MKVQLTILLSFFCIVSFSQSTITGNVTDTNRLPLVGVNVKVQGDAKGTTTDFDGKYTLKTAKKIPYTIVFSITGFETQEVLATSDTEKLNIILTDKANKLDEIVVSASRTPERVIESPVTIERMGAQQIKNTTSPTFYDGLENLKEVHFNTSSLGFKSINTRGFSTVANTRFMQLVDGMDNASPALNFVLGNLIGVSDIDVANVELLPGASSALYGANAFNGILFMNSKSPFTSPGISTYVKSGQTSQKIAGTNAFYDVGIRAAHVFSPYFAAKANFTYLTATEWIAGSTKDVNGGAVGHDLNQNYDGLNVYGDEVSTFIKNVGQVSRTGYNEQDLNDNKVKSFKADASLHFRPFANDFEIIAQFKIGTGNTIYQGANRYALKNFQMNQFKVEVKGKNFFWRSYTTGEDAGDSYDMRFAAINTNRLAKSDPNWFRDYATAFQLSSAVLGKNANDAALYAREFADYNVSPGLPLVPYINPSNPSEPSGPRFVPNDPNNNNFKNALNAVITDPDLKKGAKFSDNSSLYHTDANYNFKDIIKFAEIQVGGSFRQYVMNSKGTIFTDYDGAIKYSEYGAYTQLSKKVIDDRLKFTGSVRYDKSQNFAGSFSPRVSLVYSAGESKKHNFRVSYQTGFRNPTTQDQYIGLDLGPYALIGSAPDNLSRYTETQKTSTGATVNLSGNDAYHNSYVASSVQAFSVSNKPSDLIVAQIGLVKPERVQAVEAGYRSVINEDFSIDINGYYNIYNDFLNQSRVITPYFGTVGTDFTNPNTAATVQALATKDYRVFQVYTNSRTEVTSKGFGIGLSKKVYKNFEVSANYNYADFKFDQAKDPSFIAGFNTPKQRVKASIGNDKLFKNFGFNANIRWSTAYLWEASFTDGMVPENTVVDAQINYAFPVIKSVLKIGAANLGGKNYIQVIGAGAIGQQWFASLTTNF